MFPFLLKVLNLKQYSGLQNIVLWNQPKFDWLISHINAYRFTFLLLCQKEIKKCFRIQFFDAKWWHERWHERFFVVQETENSLNNITLMNIIIVLVLLVTIGANINEGNLFLPFSCSCSCFYSCSWSCSCSCSRFLFLFSLLFLFMFLFLLLFFSFSCFNLIL